MRSGDPCSRCGEEITLVDPREPEWSLEPDEFDEDAEVWLCVYCGWNEEADPDEALDDHMDALEWIQERIAGLPAK